MLWSEWADKLEIPAKKKFWMLVAILLSLLGFRQVHSILQESETSDEGIHLSAGYSFWKTGDFRLNPADPPLAKLLCALPLLVLRPDFSPSAEAWQIADADAIAHKFVYQNRIPADTILFAGRAVNIAIALVLGLVIAGWTLNRFGAPAALFSLLLFSCDPNIIAYSRYITSDILVTTLLLCSCMSWLAYLESGANRKLALTGVLAALTIATKFSGLILYPLLILFYLLYGRRKPALFPVRPPLRNLFLALVLLPFLIVYSLYFFDTRSVLQDNSEGSNPPSARVLSHRISYIPLPAYYYARGLLNTYGSVHYGDRAYLMGKYTDRGTWPYFPVAFTIKTPLATLLLLLLCAALAIRRLLRSRSFPLVWLVLGLPPVLFFLVSMDSALNIGLRHILPVYPFLFVLISAIVFGVKYGRFTGWVRASALFLGALLIVESLSIHPDYLPFFNQLVAGPRNGPRYLINSNVDWGQDLKKLKRWTDSHDAAPLCLRYDGEAPPQYYGISYQPLISARNPAELANLNCVVAISAGLLFGEEYERFRALHQLQPQKRIGYSIYIYDLRKTRAVASS
jgi:hypothetical protein